MSELRGTVAKSLSVGTQLLPLTVACLFVFALWKSAGMSVSFRPPSNEANIYYGLSQRAAGQAGFVDLLTWAIAAAVSLLVHTIYASRALATWARAWPLVVLLAIIALSFLWSSVPDIALRRSVKHLLLMAVVAGVAVGARSPRDVLYLAVFFTGIIMVINVAGLFLVPGVAFDASGALRGFFGHKNAAGAAMMVIVFVWLSAARWSSGLWLRVILFCGALTGALLLYATSSRTSILCAAAAILFVIPLGYCIRRPMPGIIITLISAFICLLVFYVFFLLNVTSSDLLDFIEGERKTLSGRAAVWDIAYNAFLENRLLGTGFGSLWSTGGVPPVEQYSNLLPTPFLLGLTQAHSGYFDILATLGIVGAVALSVLLASILWTNIRATRKSERDESLSPLAELTSYIFFAALMFNLTQSAFFQGNILWMFFMLSYLTLCAALSATKRADSARPESVSAHVSPS